MAGAQEKTALLWDNGWRLPLGTTPSTHILKTRTGHLQNGIDMSSSLENEFLRLKLATAFGFPVNEARIGQFDGIEALVVQRFDRSRSETRLLRLPQEDFCQALGIGSVAKYEQDGGPGMAGCLSLLAASIHSVADREAFLAAQIFFWMIGATDGHAKNFSIFLGPGGFRLTPFYDILSAEPARASGQIRHQQMQLAMAVQGAGRHYRIDQIHPRHFVTTARQAGLGSGVIEEALRRLVSTPDGVFAEVAGALPAGFPAGVRDPILTAARHRHQLLCRYFDGYGANCT